MFKRGDKVKCLVAEYGDETVGNIYTVSSHQSSTGWFNVAKDDEGDPNSYRPEHFELVKEEKAMKINYTVLNDSVVLNYSGKTIVVASDDERFNMVLTCIREERLADIPGVVEIERKYNGDGIELKDGLLVANNEPLPAELEARILKFKELKLPYAPLLKFWENLKKNPSFNARKMLFKFLEHNGIAMTSDGHFIAYRGVKEDFTDVHTGTFNNKPGSVCQMDRNLVDDNPNNTCSTGLHVACYSYAKSFGAKTIEVKVNPADVVAVPTDYNGTKMRTCRFEVVQECEAENDCLIKDVESEEEECDNCGDSDCFNHECEDARHEYEEGEARQRRYAVRRPLGTFIKAGS